MVNRFVADDSALTVLLAPRRRLVLESEPAIGHDEHDEHGRLIEATFTAVTGPMRRYTRTVRVESIDAAGLHHGTEVVDFRLAVPYFGLLFVGPARAVLRRPSADGRQPWWAPPDRIDARAATVLGVLCAASLVVGYLNTLLTQTIAFAADEFGSSDSAQGVALAVVRGGILFTLVLVGVADRRGRRAVILAMVIASPLFAATGAVAPTLAWLTVSQTVARPLAMALGIVLGIVAAEEMPAGSRAYAVSLLAMATALGAGLCVIALPLADVGTRGWRWVYVLPLASLLLVPGLARRLPESRRFLAPHAKADFAGHGRRFWLLAISGLLLNLLIAPASAFQNRYLKNERGFSARRISLYTLLTNTPGGIGIVVGGRIADVRGRRVVGAVALAGGALATVATFQVRGWPLWAWSVIGAVVGAAAVPSLGVYGAELFPTSLRGRANGAIQVLTLVGSAIGLVTAGLLVDHLGGFGPTMAILGIGPLVVAVLVITRFPETARRELEELNPEDAAPAVGSELGDPGTDRIGHG